MQESGLFSGKRRPSFSPFASPATTPSPSSVKKKKNQWGVSFLKYRRGAMNFCESPVREAETDRLSEISRLYSKQIFLIQRVMRGHVQRNLYYRTMCPENGNVHSIAIQFLNEKTPRKWYHSRVLYECFRHLQYFTRLTVDLGVQLCSYVYVRQYAAGDIVCNIHDAPVSAYIILKGKAEVLNVDLSPIAIIPEGSIFGDVGVLKNEERTATIKASDDGKMLLLIVDRMDFLKFTRSRDQGEMRARLDLLKSVEELAPCKRNVLDKICLLLQKVYVRPGKILYRAGDKVDQIAIIAAGNCDIVPESIEAFHEDPMPLHPSKRDVDVHSFQPLLQQYRLQGRKKRPINKISVLQPKQFIGEKLLFSGDKELLHKNDIIGGPSGAIVYSIDRFDLRNTLDPAALLRFKKRIKLLDPFRKTREEKSLIPQLEQIETPEEHHQRQYETKKFKQRSTKLTAVRGAWASIRDSHGIDEFREKMTHNDPVLSAAIGPSINPPNDHSSASMPSLLNSSNISQKYLGRARSTSPGMMITNNNYSINGSNHVSRASSAQSVYSIPGRREGAQNTVVTKGLMRMLPPASPADFVITALDHHHYHHYLHKPVLRSIVKTPNVMLDEQVQRLIQPNSSTWPEVLSTEIEENDDDHVKAAIRKLEKFHVQNNSLLSVDIPHAPREHVVSPIITEYGQEL